MLKIILIASGTLLVMFFLLVLFSLMKAASRFDRQMEQLSAEIPFRKGENSGEAAK